MNASASPRFTGTDLEIPPMFELIGALSDYMMEVKRAPTVIKFRSFDDQQTEIVINLITVTGIDFSPFDEYFRLIGLDESFVKTVLHLRRNDAKSLIIQTGYVEVE